MNIYGIAVARNEGDVIADSIAWAARFCDHIWIWDLASTDGTWDALQRLASPKVTAERREGETFVNSIRGRIFETARPRIEDGSWVYIIDADEFFVGDPRPMLEDAEREGRDLVGVWQVNFLPTHDDVARLRSLGEQAWCAIPLTQRMTHYRVEWFEHRFVHVVPGMTWDYSGAFSVCRHPDGQRLRLSRQYGFVRHYRYRSPAQVARRYSTRFDHGVGAGGMFQWTTSDQFAAYARPARRLLEWKPGEDEVPVPRWELLRAWSVWTWARGIHHLQRRLRGLRSKRQP